MAAGIDLYKSFQMAKIQSKTIVFITGAYVNHACWDDWRTWFESKGYKTLAPSWPHKEGNAATLRSRQPDRDLAAVTLPDIINHHLSIIQQLPEKPILIGHSFGGMLAQVLLNKGVGDACVAIHSIPPQGVLPYEINFLRSNAATLGFFTNLNKTYLMPFKKWQFAFTNGLPLDEQQRSYDQLVIPESKRAARGALTSAAKVDFAKEHQPLLILAGSRDQCIPASLNRRTYNRYKGRPSVVDFVLKDRTHYVLGLPTWKEDAAYILDWLQQH